MKLAIIVGENTPAYGIWMRVVMQVCAFAPLIHLTESEVEHLTDKLRADEQWQSALKATQIGRYADSVGAGSEGSSAKRLLQEMLLCRTVDAFNCYLTEVLYGVLRGRPEILRSSEQIKIDEALKFQTMDELVHHIAENKVTQLGHNGFDAILKFITERMGVEIDGITDAEIIFSAVREVIAVRNILVHNGGKVNRLFVEKTRRTDIALGDIFPFEKEKFTLWMIALVATSTSIDEALIEKYGPSAFSQIADEGEFVIAERRHDLPAKS